MGTYAAGDKVAVIGEVVEDVCGHVCVRLGEVVVPITQLHVQSVVSINVQVGDTVRWLTREGERRMGRVLAITPEHISNPRAWIYTSDNMTSVVPISELSR